MYQSPKSEPGDNLGLTIDVEVIYYYKAVCKHKTLYLQGISWLEIEFILSCPIHWN